VNSVLVILVLLVLLVAASVVLGRMTQQVTSARDTEYLELEGHWIRYRVDGGGPPVLLVHGWLSSGRLWTRLAEQLSRRFTVYSLDLTGFGESDKPVSGYGVRYGSRLLYAFCAHFGLTRTAVIGHDLGGAMVVKLAADHSDVVGRLVLVATPANQDQIDLPTLLWLATLPVVGPLFYTVGRYMRPLRKLWMRPFVFDPQDLSEEAVEDAGRSTPVAVTKTLDVTRREISRSRLLRQAGIIKVPTLVITGEDDRIVDPQSAMEWAGVLPAEAVLLDRCGHLPMLERPDEFNAQVLSFLTGDSSYLSAAPEEMREDLPIAETSGEPSLPELSETPDERETGGKPRVHRKRGGSYSSRSRETEEGHGDVPTTGNDRPVEDSADRSTGNGVGEQRPLDRTDRDGDGAGIPELPKGLFDWPDSMSEPRPWNRPPEEQRRAGEEHGEGADQEEGPESPHP
jgi:pimeloyl-ACP methyl ester carboxylesterase